MSHMVILQGRLQHALKVVRAEFLCSSFEELVTRRTSLFRRCRVHGHGVRSHGSSSSLEMDQGVGQSRTVSFEVRLIRIKVQDYGWIQAVDVIKEVVM